MLELDPDPNSRQLLIKNPWRSGETWKEIGSTSLASSTESKSKGPAHLHDQTGTFWMNLADVTQNFESIYLNWNPARFTHRQDHHFVWDLSPRKDMSATVIHNPQFSMVAGEDGEVWILLARHFTDEEMRLVRQRSRNPDTAQVENNSIMGFISLYVFDNGGKRVQMLSGSVCNGPFVDSPQTLVKFKAKKGRPYTVVPVHDGLPLQSCTFTLSLFANQRLAVASAEDGMRYYLETKGAWTRRTAGGNSGSTMYGANPQFSITVPQPTPLSLLLSSDAKDIRLHVDLVWADGHRVGPSLAVKDVLADSGQYVFGAALLSADTVDAGTYTVVCSTFEEGQLADFTLRMGSAAPIVVKPVPAEGAGRMRTPLERLFFHQNETVLRAQLRVSRLTRLCASVGITPPAAPNELPRRSSTPLRISLVRGRGPSETVLAESGKGEFKEPTAGLRTPDSDVEGRGEEVWVVVERVGGIQGQETFQVEILGDGPVEVGKWKDLS